MNVKTKKEAASVLTDVYGDKRFFCNDLTICCNLGELAACLESMSDAVYNHHVTPLRNDFTNWVRDVLLDDTLASDLSETAIAIEAAGKVRERISWLQAKIGSKKE